MISEQIETYVSSPAGSVLSEENQKEIVKFCVRESLVLLADEVSHFVAGIFFHCDMFFQSPSLKGSGPVSELYVKYIWSCTCKFELDIFAG